MRKIIFVVLLNIFMISCNSMYAREHPYFIRCMSLSPDSRYIAIGRLDNKIILLDRENKRVLKVIEYKVNNINLDTAFTPDSKYFIFQDNDMYINFYDIENGKIVKRIKLDDYSSAIAFFKDMKKMIWGSPSGKIELFDLETQEKRVLKIEFPRPPTETAFAPIWDIIISPDERHFLTITRTSDDLDYDEPEEDIRPGTKYKDLFPNNVKHCGVNLWDAKTFKKINKFMANNLSGCTWAAFSKDGNYIVITSEGGVTVWDLNTFNILYQVHVLSDNCGFVDKNGEYFVTSLPENSKLRLYRLQDIINPKEPVIITKVDFLKMIPNLDKTWEDLVKNGYIDEKGILQPKSYRLRGGKDLVLDRKYKSYTLDDICGVFRAALPLQMKMIKLKYEPCSLAMVTDPDRNLIITGDADGSISVYKFDPKKLEIKLEWHPKSIVAGVIRWLDPFAVMFSSKEEVEEMTKQYEVNQLRIIDEERKKGTVETKYETVELPENKEKVQKQPVSTLTPVK